MKYAVINFSGNVGKTTISRHLLAANMPNCKIVSVETINDQNNDAAVSARHFDDILREITGNENVVVDIGASNVEELLLRSRKVKGSHRAIDFFVIPIVQDNKQQNDTIFTVDALQKLGVSMDHIIPVFNKVEFGVSERDARRGFNDIIDTLGGLGIDVDFSMGVEDNEIFDILRRNPEYLGEDGNGSLVAFSNESIEELHAACRETEDRIKRLALLNREMAIRLAMTAADNLRAVYGVFERKTQKAAEEVA